MVEHGIDVSRWNDVTDWHAVRDNGITFVSVKVTEGTTHVDPVSSRHVSGAREAGVTTGGYHYARPEDTAAQVAHFADRLSELGLLNDDSLWPMLDMEADGFDDPDGFVRDFVHRFREYTGTHGLLVYANRYWFTQVLRPDEWLDDGVLLWIARYNGDPGTTEWEHPRLALHQYTNTGSVPGVNGHVDRDVTVGGWTVAAFTVGGGSPRTHTVQPGETLRSIAALYGVDWQELARINGIENPDLIHPGQVLRIP
ncbi:MAG TPA: GH25 family lysozyme [Pseudonocardiaceae bacterium]